MREQILKAEPVCPIYNTECDCCDFCGLREACLSSCEMECLAKEVKTE